MSTTANAEKAAQEENGIEMAEQVATTATEPNDDDAEAVTLILPQEEDSQPASALAENDAAFQPVQPVGDPVEGLIFDPVGGPYPWAVYKENAVQVRKEILAGLTVAFSQVPESVAFAFLAGVNPLVALHATWIMGIFCSAFGSRPGMISGATGAVAAVIGEPVRRLGINYLFGIVMMSGIVRCAAAALRLGKFSSMISLPVMFGFTNGLALVIAMAQAPAFTYSQKQITALLAANATGAAQLTPTTLLPGETVGLQLVLVVVTILIIHFLPRLTTAVPSSLVGIVVATLIENFIFRLAAGVSTPTIGEVSVLNGGMPLLVFNDPQYDLPPFTLATLWAMLGPGAVAATASMVECVMTMEVVSDLTETRTENRNQMLAALGVGNFICGMYGTMGGGAMIGSSMINIHSGANGRFRISGIVASVTVLLCILVLSPAIAVVPTSALVGVMVIVVVHTFEWRSLAMVFVSMLPLRLREHPRLRFTRKINRTDAATVVLVTSLTLITNLLVAVLVGVVFSSLAQSWDTGTRITVNAAEIRIPVVGRKRRPLSKASPAAVVDAGGECSEDALVDGSGGDEGKASGDPSAEPDVGEAAGDDDGMELTKVYRVTGPLFFANARQFRAHFTPRSDPARVEVHLDGSALRDYSAFEMLNTVGAKYASLGKEMSVHALDEGSVRLVNKARGLVEHFTYHVESDEDRLLRLATPRGLRITSNFSAPV